MLGDGVFGFSGFRVGKFSYRNLFYKNQNVVSELEFLYFQKIAGKFYGKS